MPACFLLCEGSLSIYFSMVYKLLGRISGQNSGAHSVPAREGEPQGRRIAPGPYG